MAVSFSSVVRVQIMSLPASLNNKMTGPGWVTDGFVEKLDPQAYHRNSGPSVELVADNAYPPVFSICNTSRMYFFGNIPTRTK